MREGRAPAVEITYRVLAWILSRLGGKGVDWALQHIKCTEGQREHYNIADRCRLMLHIALKTGMRWDVVVESVMRESVWTPDGFREAFRLSSLNMTGAKADRLHERKRNRWCYGVALVAPCLHGDPNV
jgi:hypothetical protein